MSIAGGHVHEDELELYAGGRLRNANLESVEEHLLVCESCLDRLESEETYVRAMKVALVRDRQAPDSAWQQLLRTFATPAPRWAGAMAAVALVAVVTLIPRSLRKSENVEPVTVQLEAMKGDAANAVPDRPLALVLDGRGLPAASDYRLQIVNGRGKAVWQATAVAEHDTLRALVSTPLGPGRYFVRVYASSTELREFELQIQ